MRLALTCWLVLFSVFTSSAAGFPPRIGFGVAVDGAGDVNGDGFDDVIVGAHSYTHPESAEGAAFVYFGAASAAFAEQPDWQVELDEANAYFGRVVAGIGDVNNDGYDDILVQSPNHDNPASAGDLEGLVAVYHGSPTGPSSVPDTVIVGTFDNQQIGLTAAGAGDVNNDGYDDVVLSGYEPAGGRVYVHHGSPSGLSASPSQTLTTGGTLASAGDVNNDGFDDVIMGMYPDTASVHLGSMTGLAATPFWQITIPGAGYFGCDVSSAGDVNNDGFDDVIVSDCFDGKIYGFYGPDLTTGGPTFDWFVNIGLSGAGESISSAGDVNNDGFDDVIVGFSRYFIDNGRVYVHLGSNSGLDANPVAVLDGPLIEEWFGWAVADVGDVDNDGFDDVIVTNCPTCGVGTPAYESAKVYRGRSDGIWSSVPVTVDLDVAGTAGFIDGSLVLEKSGSYLILAWDPASCDEGIIDYVVYEGTLGDFGSHVPKGDPWGGPECSRQSGYTSAYIDSPSGSAYYLVVPRRTQSEGSYGLAGGSERLPSAQACVPQLLGSCP